MFENDIAVYRSGIIYYYIYLFIYFLGIDTYFYVLGDVNELFFYLFIYLFIMHIHIKPNKYNKTININNIILNIHIDKKKHPA